MALPKGLNDDEINQELLGCELSSPLHSDVRGNHVPVSDHTYCQKKITFGDEGNAALETSLISEYALQFEFPEFLLSENNDIEQIFHLNKELVVEVNDASENPEVVRDDNKSEDAIQTISFDHIFPLNKELVIEVNNTSKNLEVVCEDNQSEDSIKTNSFEHIFPLNKELLVEVNDARENSEVVREDNLDNQSEDAINTISTQESSFAAIEKNCVDVDELFDSDDTETQDDPDYEFPGSEEAAMEDSNSMENYLAQNDNDKETPILPDRKRKKNNSMNWKKNVNKKLRMSGKAYVGYRRTKEGNVFQDQERGERTMGPSCTSKMCQKSKLRNCQDFTEEQRQQIFKSFWEGMNWDQRKIYLVNMVTKKVVQRRTTVLEGEDDTSRRGNTLQYFLISNGVKKQVCQNMFLQTLGIKKWTVRYWVCGDKNKDIELLEGHTSAGMVPQASVTRPSSCKKSKKPKAIAFAKSFLDSLAKLPSHYCRKDSNRLYLEPVFNSLSHVYRIYSERCNQVPENESTDGSPVCLSRNIFEKIFKDMNLAVYHPKKDMCDTCVGHQVGNVSDEEYSRHTLLKEEARKEKDKDKNKSKEGKALVFCSDVEAVKVSPCLNASALYYKTKLCVHNFTMYNLNTKEAHCFWFDETSGELVASVFASCVIATLKAELQQDLKPVILWSDGCPNQNRNAVFSNALLHLSVECNVTIEQKFLVKGHTQMECDSVHSTIETALKGKTINIPSQYHQITMEARKEPFPYKSKYLSHTFFKDFSKKETIIYDSIRPGRVKGDPTVYDISAIKYNPNGKIETKLDFKSEYQELPRRPKSNAFIKKFPNLYKEKIPIPASKFKHLQELKAVLPEDCHSFYDNLPHL